MREKLDASLLILLVLLSFSSATQEVFAVTSPLHQNEGNLESKCASKLKCIMQTNMETSSLSLLLSTDKDAYYRQETVFSTSTFLYEQTPIQNALVTLEVTFPNGTSWFVWTNNTDETGFAAFRFLLPIANPSGQYAIYATTYKEGLENVSATTKFTILNLPPEIHSVKIIPEVVEQPTIVSIKANVTDFEEGTDIQVKCAVSIPNGTVQRFDMIFDVAFFSLNYQIQQRDPVGTYKVTVEASDSEGAFAQPYVSSFENAKAVHDVAVLGISLSTNMVFQGEPVTINVTVANEGMVIETFSVVVYVNTTAIEAKEVTLTIGASTTRAFLWNTTGFLGNYMVVACVSSLPGEIDLSDNTYVDGIVQVIPCAAPIVIIDQALVSDYRVDVGSLQQVSFHARRSNWSEIVDGTIYVNETGYVTNQTGWITFEHASDIVGKTTWVVTGVLCNGITEFESNGVSCIWDRIEIFDGGVSHPMTNLTQTETIWFKAQYEFDSMIFDESEGLLFVNGSGMVWSEMNNRWEKAFNFATVGNRMFMISDILDHAYDLTVINNVVEPLSISWVEMVFFVQPPALGCPILINATEMVNALIIIENISMACMLQILPTTMPGPPPEGLKSCGKPFEINTTGNPTGIFKIRIYYSEEELTNLGIEEDTLKIYVWKGDEWVQLAKSNVNSTENYVEVVVNHFSIFNLMGVPSPRLEPRLLWLILIIVVVSVFAISIVLFLRKKRANLQSL